MKLFRKSILFLIVLATSLCFLGLGANDVRAVEDVKFSTGFEDSEGFTATTTYNNTTVKTFGPSNQQWGILSGTASTSSPIDGSQSIIIRLYKSTNYLKGYAEMQFDLSDISYVSFQAKVSNVQLYAKVEYSTDKGETWAGAKDYELSKTATTYNYSGATDSTLPSGDIRFRISLQYSSNSTDKTSLYIDSFKAYGDVSSTISYNNEGVITEGEIAENGLAVKPDDPTRDRYNFGGWYTENTYENKWDFESDVVEGTVTLYAKWIPASKTLDFEALSTKTSLMLDFIKNQNDQMAEKTFTVNSSTMVDGTLSLPSDLGLSNDIFSLSVINATTNLKTQINSRVIRLYANNSITIEGIDEITFISASISYENGYAVPTVENSTLTDGKYIFDEGTHTFTITSEKQSRITSISFTCKVNGTITCELTSAALRFGTSMSSALYDALVNEGAEEFGVVYVKGSFDNLTKATEGAQKVAITPVKVTTEWGTEVSETGAYTQFALVLTGIGYENVGTKVTARVYVVVGGVTYYMEQATHSVQTMCQEYLKNSEIAEKYSDILNHIKDYVVE